MGSTFNSLRSFSEEKEFGLELKVIWLGVTVSLGIWLTAAALGLVWTLLNGSGIYWFGLYTYLTGILGVFMGGVLTGIRAENKGWLYGLWVGLLLSMFGIIVTLELMPNVYSWGAIGRQILVWTLWGITGGYLGYYVKPGTAKKDLKKNERSRGL